MNNMLEKIRSKLYIESVKNKQNSKIAGRFGEKIAKTWLEEEWDVIDVTDDNEPFFNSDEFYNGDKKRKRPDFVSIFDDKNDEDKIILWDAKFHDVHNNKFKLTNSELNKYFELKKFFCEKLECNTNDVYVIFMVLPKCYDGKKMYLVHLSQFKKGQRSSFGDDEAIEVTLNEDNFYDTSLIQEKKYKLK